jgi:hypothetical protein
MSDIEGAVRDAAQADNRFCAKPAAARRAGLDGAELQHPMSPLKNAERQPALSRRNRSFESLDRQHGDQSRR